MKINIEPKFNPFYDSKFRISVVGEDVPENRMLVGLYNDELMRLRIEIDDLLNRMGIDCNKEIKNQAKQVHKQSKTRKIPVAIVYDDIYAANRMLHELEPRPLDIIVHHSGLVETRSLIVHLIKLGDTGFCGTRLSFVYTTKEIADSEWFKVVIRPMITGGIGEIV